MHQSFDRHMPEQRATQLISRVPAPVVCESCGNVLKTRADAFNVMFVCQIGVPGHAAIPPFQCDSEEHWACSKECWQKVAHACIDQHMMETLNQIYSQLEDKAREYEKTIQGGN